LLYDVTWSDVFETAWIDALLFFSCDMNCCLISSLVVNKLPFNTLSVLKVYLATFDAGFEVELRTPILDDGKLG